METSRKLLATLDEDDILHPEEALKRQELGIDIDYMVKHLGQQGDDS